MHMHIVTNSINLLHVHDEYMQVNPLVALLLSASPSRALKVPIDFHGLLMRRP